jgi:hypothetical protein
MFLHLRLLDITGNEFKDPGRQVLAHSLRL